MYEYYVNLLHNCSEVIVYNFETNGFGKQRMFGGKTLEFFDDNHELRYSLMDKQKPKINDYGYYETKIDLDILKIRGSSQSYKLIPTTFSAINVMEQPHAIFQQQMLYCQQDKVCSKTLESDETIIDWWL